MDRSIQQNIDAQFFTTIPNVQPGVSPFVVPALYEGLKLEGAAHGMNALGDAFEQLGQATRRLELAQEIERRCAGHIRRQARVRR